MPGGIFFFFIHPGGKTPCESFPAEKVCVGEESVLGGGNPGCYGMLNWIFFSDSSGAQHLDLIQFKQAKSLECTWKWYKTVEIDTKLVIFDRLIFRKHDSDFRFNLERKLSPIYHSSTGLNFQCNFRIVATPLARYGLHPKATFTLGTEELSRVIEGRRLPLWDTRF